MPLPLAPPFLFLTVRRWLFFMCFVLLIYWQIQHMFYVVYASLNGQILSLLDIDYCILVQMNVEENITKCP